MNRFRHPFILTILIFISYTAKGQFVPGVPTFINTPYGNIPIPTYYHMPMAYFNLGNRTSAINTKDYYMVRLKNDSTIKVYGEIDLTDSIHTLNVKEKRKVVRKILPSQTNYIVALGEKNLRVAGNPNDSCWVFQQLKDSVSLYSVVPASDESYSLFYSKSGNTDLISITEANLLALVGNDEELVKIIKKDKNYVKAIKKYNAKLKSGKG